MDLGIGSSPKEINCESSILINFFPIIHQYNFLIEGYYYFAYIEIWRTMV